MKASWVAAIALLSVCRQAWEAAGEGPQALSVDRPKRKHHDRGMLSRRIYDDELHAHFVTFSCYRRRGLLDHDRAKRVALGVLNSPLARRKARCVGFVVKRRCAKETGSCRRTGSAFCGKVSVVPGQILYLLDADTLAGASSMIQVRLNRANQSQMDAKYIIPSLGVPLRPAASQV